MTDPNAPRYAYHPRSAFAATRAFAGRTTTGKSATSLVAVGRARRLLHRLTGR